MFEKQNVNTDRKEQFIILSPCFKFEDHFWIKTFSVDCFNTLVSKT